MYYSIHVHVHVYVQYVLLSYSRWIRLLFSREFLLPSVLELWDAMFVEGASLSLMDYFFVVMLMQFRDKSELSCNYCVWFPGIFQLQLNFVHKLIRY